MSHELNDDLIRDGRCRVCGKPVVTQATGGEELCKPLTCPDRERCIWRMDGIMEADKPCVPSLRRRVRELEAEVLAGRNLRARCNRDGGQNESYEDADRAFVELLTRAALKEE